MITVKLMGGVGNQAFQFACGKALSIARGEPMQLDISYPEKDPLRPYMLSQFPHLRDFPTVRKTRGRRIREQSARYTPEVFARIKGDFTIIGYWQSERWFEAISDDIARGFHLSRFGEELKENTCALHIRRTDYLGEASQNVMGPSLGFEYYNHAAARIVGLHGPVDFKVFSDDPQWCRDNAGCVPYPITVEHGSTMADLEHMSRCQHIICANSSFSWWAAWLGDRNWQGRGTRTVIVPRKWFAKRDDADVCPARWLKL